MATERTTRIYAVTSESNMLGEPPALWLVEAKTKAAALSHVAKQTIKVEIASQSQMFQAAKAGIEIEKAGDES